MSRKTVERKPSLEGKLYPPIAPYNAGTLPVSDIHTLYFEESGNPNGKPLVVLHGGPGAGSPPSYRQYFDPEHYRIILFDQRGAGKSGPSAELKENTTWDLIDDIENLREKLDIDEWHVFGGSWGSTLALAYASHHPERVSGMILRGIFLCRNSELSWFYEGGASQIFPDEWEKYAAPFPNTKKGGFIQAYHDVLTGKDEEKQLEAAKAWSTWELSTSRLVQDVNLIKMGEDPKFALAFARIECHYFVNSIFMESDDYLLNKTKEISHIPTRVIQGRYDMVCPMTTAWDLKKTMNISDEEFRVVPDAGHSGLEAGIQKELLLATEDFKNI